MPVHDEERTVVIRRGAPSTFAPGTVLGHTYVIEAVLGRGGTGEVYRAKHAELGTIHAVKLIPASLANNPKVLQLLVEEARKLGRVHNDAIVNYEGLFRGEGDLRYLVMEFIEGESLTKTLDMGASPAAVIATRQRLPDLSAVPASLRPVIEPMLQPRPEDRPGSMRELLDATAKARPPSARIRASLAPRAPRNWRRPLLI